jgi:hypothetical protein
MTELVTALLAFLSAGVFLAHAYDAYRGGQWTELNSSVACPGSPATRWLEQVGTIRFRSGY